MRRKWRKDILLVTGFVCVISFGFTSDTPLWQKSGTGIHESDIRVIKIHPTDQRIIYVGTSRALYRSDNQGEDYRPILTLKGEKEGVNDIYVDAFQSNNLLVATDVGLYESKDNGRTWRRSYTASDKKSRVCLSVMSFEGAVYIGTLDGVLIREGSTGHWSRLNNMGSAEPVYQIEKENDLLYFATDRSLYRYQISNGQLDKVFSTTLNATVDINGEVNGRRSVRENRSMKFLYIDQGEWPALYMAAKSGVYFSTDQGGQWQRIPSGNLPMDELTSLIALNTENDRHGHCRDGRMGCRRLLAGSLKGTFLYKEGSWIPLYKGMETNRVHDLTKDAKETVYAATERGIFYLPAEKTPPLEGMPDDPFSNNIVMKDLSMLNVHFSNEPSVSQVHQWAIDYAEVSPDKIKKWRSLARTKAFLPDVSVGLDRAGSDLYHWNTGASPDELQKGKDYTGWDVSLSWDFADLIWSTDQTTIDSRSKLMVELREDILDQITRLYFERRRLQTELLNQPIFDQQAKLDQQMRVAELTALIDALTGGRFSREIQMNMNKSL